MPEKGQVICRDGDVRHHGLPRLQMGFGHALQFQIWSCQRGHRVMNEQKNGLLTGHAPLIGDIRFDRQHITGPDLRRRNLEIAHLEVRVGKAVAEGEERLHRQVEIFA